MPEQKSAKEEICPLCNKPILPDEKKFRGCQPDAKGPFHWRCYWDKHGNDQSAKDADLIRIRGAYEGKAEKMRQ